MGYYYVQKQLDTGVPGDVSPFEKKSGKQWVNEENEAENAM